MQVNQGNVRFGDFKYIDGELSDQIKQGTEPERNWSLRDLFEESFQNEYYVDNGKTVRKYNVDRFIQKATDNVFLVGNKHRILRDKYTEEGFVTFDPYSDYEQTYEKRRDYLTSVKSDDVLMKSVLMTISLDLDSLRKRCAICYFLHNGLHQKDDFKLVTEFNKDEVLDYSKEALEQLTKDNSEINEVIEKYRQEYKETIPRLVEELYENFKNFTDESNWPILQKYVSANIDKLLFDTSNNLVRDVIGTRAGKGWLSEDRESLFQQKDKQEIQKFLTGSTSSTKNDLRSAARKVLNTSITVLNKDLGIPAQKSQSARNAALVWLIEQYQ